MMEANEMATAAQFMCRTYKKEDGTYPENPKELAQTPAWKAAKQKATQLATDSGQAIDDQQATTMAFLALLEHKQDVEAASVHLVHARCVGLRKARGGWEKTDPGVMVVDSSGQTHHIEGATLPDDVIPGSPLTLRGELKQVTVFGSRGKADKPGRAYDPPFERLNVPKNVEIEVGGHKAPFPQEALGLKRELERAYEVDRKNHVIWCRAGPSDYDGIEGGLPVMGQLTVRRAFLNEYDDGNKTVLTICESTDGEEVDVVHPIEEIVKAFPAAANASEDNIGEIVAPGSRMLCVGNVDVGRAFFLSKMEGEEQAKHEQLLQELAAKEFLFVDKNNNRKLTLKNNATYVDEEDGNKEKPIPFVTLGDRKYVNISTFTRRDGTEDAKFVALAKDVDSRPRFNCYERSGDGDDGEAWAKGVGFQCTFLETSGVQVPSKTESAAVQSIFG